MKYKFALQKVWQDSRHDIIMTDEVQLLNMIFQHMFLSGKTDVDRSAGAFSRRLWCVAIFKCSLTFMKCFAAQPLSSYQRGH